MDINPVITSPKLPILFSPRLTANVQFRQQGGGSYWVDLISVSVQKV